jgi:hypothetical protein
MRSRYKAKFKILRRRARRSKQEAAQAIGDVDGGHSPLLAPLLKALPQMLQIVIVLVQTWRR